MSHDGAKPSEAAEGGAPSPAQNPKQTSATISQLLAEGSPSRPEPCPFEKLVLYRYGWGSCKIFFSCTGQAGAGSQATWHGMTWAAVVRADLCSAGLFPRAGVGRRRILLLSYPGGVDAVDRYPGHRSGKLEGKKKNFFFFHLCQVVAVFPLLDRVPRRDARGSSDILLL